MSSTTLICSSGFPESWPGSDGLLSPCSSQWIWTREWRCTQSSPPQWLRLYHITSSSVLADELGALSGFVSVCPSDYLTLAFRQIRVARRIFEEDSDARNKRNAIIDMLRDVANKYTSLETHRGGDLHSQRMRRRSFTCLPCFV